MWRQFVRDEVSQVKPAYKGRSKFELYIHNQEFRDLIKSHTFYVPTEDFQGRKLLKKKMLIKNEEFSLLLQKICLYYYRSYQKQISLEAIQIQLHAIVGNAINSSNFINTHNDALSDKASRDQLNAEQEAIGELCRLISKDLIV